MRGRCNLASESSFVRPTLTKLIRRAKSDISTRLPGADANLRGSPEEVLAISQAGLTHGLHGHLKWVSKQVHTDLSDDDQLIREASTYGLYQTAAVPSAGQATITGVETTVCPDQTVWVRGDGVEYVQNGAATITSGQAVIELVAVLGGTDGDAVSGVALEISSPVTGITSEATVSGDGITDGVEIESVAALRARLLARKRNPAKGGGPGDYVAWALSVAGVTRAWEYPLMLGPGTVGVAFTRDNDVTILPSVDEVAAVQTYIDSVRPVTAEVTVFAPIEDTLNFTIELTPDTTEVRAAVTAELQALMLAEAEPATTLRLSAINEAISIAAGETDHVLTSPVADVTPAAGHISIFGSITWA